MVSMRGNISSEKIHKFAFIKFASLTKAMQLITNLLLEVASIDTKSLPEKITCFRDVAWPVVRSDKIWSN